LTVLDGAVTTEPRQLDCTADSDQKLMSREQRQETTARLGTAR